MNTEQIKALRQDIAGRLKNRRTQLGITQVEVAHRSGQSTPSVANYEAGRAIPSIPALIQICKALETTPDDILLG